MELGNSYVFLWTSWYRQAHQTVVGLWPFWSNESSWLIGAISVRNHFCLWPVSNKVFSKQLGYEWKRYKLVLHNYVCNQKWYEYDVETSWWRIKWFKSKRYIRKCCNLWRYLEYSEITYSSLLFINSLTRQIAAVRQSSRRSLPDRPSDVFAISSRLTDVSICKWTKENIQSYRLGEPEWQNLQQDCPTRPTNRESKTEIR